MKIINKKLLKLFSGQGICEFCRRHVRSRDAHHLRERGMGGGSRLDIRINLIALCSTFAGGLNCHQRYHDGKVTREQLLAVVASREGTTVDKINEAMDKLWLLDKAASSEEVAKILEM